MYSDRIKASSYLKIKEDIRMQKNIARPPTTGTLFL
tara:strand:- start:630 stop:737 length:108 start_codon:yes stop_codon:yes gene_type:complete